MFTSDNKYIISIECFSYILKSVNYIKIIKLVFKFNKTF
jgi:hypothetical protein